MAFDIDRYTENSTSVAWGDLDFDTFRTQPLPENTLRSLRYMCDVEYHTVCYLRDMLVTPSHKDAEVSAFMTMWNREEFWHGEALAAVLAMHGVTVDYDALKAKRVKLGWKDRLDPVKQTVMGGVVGKDFIATHMSWGAVNEWCATAAYNRLAAMESHPALSELLRRIAKQETRHVAFYSTQARARLAASKKGRVLTRFALSHFWGPVGSTIMEEDEVRHVMGHLFGSAAGIDEIRRVDSHIAKLPGMEGLSIVEDSLRVRGIA